MAKKKPDIPNQVIDAALALAATRGWRALTLADIAEAAKLPLSQVYPAYASKAAILGGFTRRIDAEVPAGHEEVLGRLCFTQGPHADADAHPHVQRDRY